MHEDKFLHSIKIDNKSTLNIPLSSIERNFSETIKDEKNSLSKNISDDYKQQNKMNEGEDYSSDQDYRKLNNHVNIELLGKERNPKQDIQKEGVPFGRWVRYRDEVALDKRTNLMWMVRDYRNLKGRAPNDYKEIAGWADEINRKRYGGFNNWRIPSIEEYEAIFDSSRMRLGFAFNIETPSVNQVMRAKPVGYPKIFENGGGYWYWSNERDSRCAQLLKLPNLCFRVFNFRDGITGSRSPLGGDSMASSIRLVRGVH